MSEHSTDECRPRLKVVGLFVPYEGATDIPPKSWIVCDNGHRIAYVKDGLQLGDHINCWAERLSRWRQPEPQVGQVSDYKCDLCGASWGPVFKYEAADA
jgi:hypothetical protein